jgi:hypothetical protein
MLKARKEKKRKERANIAQNGQPSDIGLLAAESFCGMEQMTTRVELVPVITDPRCSLVPII